MSDGDFARSGRTALTLRRSRRGMRWRSRPIATTLTWRGGQSWTGCSLGQAEAFVAEQVAAAYDEPGHWFQVAIAGRVDDRLIGDIGLHVLAEDARLVEIGLSLASAAQGRGLATEAMDALIRHLFRIAASIASTPRSTRATRDPSGCFERLGFRREAHFRRHAWVKGRVVRRVCLRPARGDWMGRDAA